MIISEAQRATMLEAAKPLIAWMNENCHPHCEARVIKTPLSLPRAWQLIAPTSFLGITTCLPTSSLPRCRSHTNDHQARQPQRASAKGNGSSDPAHCEARWREAGNDYKDRHRDGVRRVGKAKESQP